MVFVLKSIDVVSPADGKRYTSTREYDKAHHARGQDVMTDTAYKQLREKLIDESKTPRKQREETNHVHIDFANGRVEKSRRDHNV
jgi:hypothetical protein